MNVAFAIFTNTFIHNIFKTANKTDMKRKIYITIIYFVYLK